ncbi:MAG: LysM peptidoglycan-binding domain-containing protein [bacterium]|nr:LysM peptidoglycan-binding domain-containing protein [bacterium]
MSSSSGKSFAGIVLVVMVLFGVGGALVDKLRHADDDQKVVEPLLVMPAADVVPVQDNSTQVAVAQKPGLVSANLANDGTGTLTGKALPDTNVALELNGKTVKTADVSKDDDFTVELEQPLASGQQILQGLEDKQAKESHPENFEQAMKKAVPPIISIPSPAPNDESGEQPGVVVDVTKSVAAPSKEDQPNILFKETAYIAAEGEAGEVRLSGTAQAGAKLHFNIDGIEIGRTTADKSGAWSLETNRSLSPGAHMLLVEQRNDKGLRIAHAQVPFDRADALSKGTQKTAWDRFAGIFKVETDANGEAPQSSSDQPKMADLTKAAPDKTTPMKLVVNKVDESKLADASKSMPKLASPAIKSADTGAEEFAFESLSYEPNKTGGLLKLSGRGIPGSRIRLSKGLLKIGEVVANSKGIWTFAKPDNMKTGSHIFKAGHLLKSGRIASEARMQYDHVAKVRDAQIAKSADQKPTPLAKPTNGSAAKMTNGRSAPYTQPAVSGEGADHSVPSGGLKSSIATTPQKGQVEQATVQRSGIEKTAPRRRVHRVQKPRRKMVRRSKTRRSKTRRSSARRSVKRRTVGSYYLSRKNKARYMAKRKRYPKSRRTPARVRVRNGTTLWGYSEHYYGRGRYYRHIQRANRRRIKNPNKIYSGQRIKVPHLRRLHINRR